MFKFIKEFFHLSNSEMKGVFVLITIIIFVFLLPRIYFYFKEPELINDTEFEIWVNNINRREDSLKIYSEVEKQATNLENNKIEYFYFDPNIVSYEEMMKLGFDGKTASILIKYRNKGAKFYSKKDLLKIYGFSNILYSKLEKYIEFPKKDYKETWSNKEESKIEYFPFDPNIVTYKEMIKIGIDGKTANILIKYRKATVFYSKEDLLKVYGFTEEKYTELEDFIQFPIKDIKEKIEKPIGVIIDTIVVDINKANVEELKRLKGIGEFRAEKIIELREKLGGFYTITQLKEVYGITDEVFKEFEKNVIVSTENIKKIDLNKAGFKELIRHSYIDKKMTIKILNLNKEIGGFNKVEDLIYYNTLTQEEFDRLKNYLVVQ